MKRGVYREVPQEFVLGPHLWNLGYDIVLRQVVLFPDCTVICYADDMIILAARKETSSQTNEALSAALYLRSGTEYGVSENGGRLFSRLLRGAVNREPRYGSRMCLSQSGPIKYLDLVLDSKWCFIEHFAPRLEKACLSDCSPT